MANWLSYSISDFLPFSLDTYNRLFVLYNARFSPAFAVGLGLGLVALALPLRAAVWRWRIVLAGFGLAWLWISWAFHLRTLQPLLWAAGPFALAFALQGGLLVACAVLPWEGRHSLDSFGGSKTGYGVLAIAVLLLAPAGSPPVSPKSARPTLSASGHEGASPVPSNSGSATPSLMISTFQYLVATCRRFNEPVDDTRYPQRSRISGWRDPERRCRDRACGFSSSAVKGSKIGRVAPSPVSTSSAARSRPPIFGTGWTARSSSRNRRRRS